MINKFQFKLGDSTTEICSGDIVSECEFIIDLGGGQMLFYDLKFRVFRKVWVEVDEEGVPYLYGWENAVRPSELLKRYEKHES